MHLWIVKMKKAIITGGSSGLGYEISKQLLKNNYKIVNISRTDSDLNVENISTDLTKNSDIIKAVEKIKVDHSDVNLLMLCSGVMHWFDIGKNPIKIIDNDINVNLTGNIKFVDSLMPLIEKNKGDVVVIGSTCSFKTYPGLSVYSASKFGILGYIESLQVEYKNKDVRIFGIHPGGFRSNLHIKAGSKFDPKRLMDPEDLAKLVLTLIKLPRNMEVSEIIINRKNPD